MRGGSDPSRSRRRIARVGAEVFCAVAGFWLAGELRAQAIGGGAPGPIHATDSSRSAPALPALSTAGAHSFSLGLDGALAGAATFPLEVAPRPPAPSWLAGPAVRPTWELEGVRLPNAFAGTTDSPPTSGRRFLLAAGELALLEVLPWIWDRYVTDEDFARISWHTVSENFKAGFGYDSDHFNINQVQHPYQGSFFFEAGRSNGYTYWESGLFALAGSFIWECCMENTRPSINDLVNTTLGGMARGEVQHRLSVMLLDNTSSGSERFWRELGAAVLNPVGAVSRLVNGDMSRHYPNPEDRFPDSFSLSADLGYRHVEGPVASENQESQGLITLEAGYGDPFRSDVRQPFDSFTASMDLTFPGNPVITRFEERGILRSWELTDRAASARQVFAFSQEYEYINNQAEVFGAQMFSGGLLSRYDLGRSVIASTDIDAVFIPLAGVKTTNFENPETGRNYDYGPGGGALAAVRLYAGENRLLSAGYGVVWTRTVNGSSDNNTLQFFRATATIPIKGPFGIGGGWWWYSRKTSYAGRFFEPRQTQSEWRVFLKVGIGATGLRAPKT